MQAQGRALRLLAPCGPEAALRPALSIESRLPGLCILERRYGAPLVLGGFESDETASPACTGVSQIILVGQFSQKGAVGRSKSRIARPRLSRLRCSLNATKSGTCNVSCYGTESGGWNRRRESPWTRPFFGFSTRAARSGWKPCARLKPTNPCQRSRRSSRRTRSLRLKLGSRPTSP